MPTVALEDACRTIVGPTARVAGATRDRLGALDGLRGVAVLIVLGSHLSNAGLLVQPGLSGAGKSGVYLFFVLSAFLLTLPLLAKPRRALTDPRLWAAYATRRVLRIWPLLLVVLLLGWALTSAGIPWHYRLDTLALVRHLTLREGQSVLWSIPVEFTFYLLLPVLAVALALLPRRTPATLVALLGVGAMVAAGRLWPYALLERDLTRLGPYLPTFLGGMFAAALHVRLGASCHPRAWSTVGLLALCGFVATLPSVWAVLADQPFRPDFNHAWMAGFGLLWSALLLALLRGPAWFRAPFETRALRGVGLISYSLYLWHMPVLDAFRLAGRPGGVVGGLVAAVAAIGAAWLSYRLFERPLRDVRWPTHAPRGPAEPSAIMTGPPG